MKVRELMDQLVKYRHQEIIISKVLIKDDADAVGLSYVDPNVTTELAEKIKGFLNVEGKEHMAPSMLDSLSSTTDGIVAPVASDKSTDRVIN